MIAQFIVAFSEYYYAADFAVAANTHLVQTVEARDRALAMKQKIRDRNPQCKAWSEACHKMQHSLVRRDRHLREANRAAKERAKQRVAGTAGGADTPSIWATGTCTRCSRPTGRLGGGSTAAAGGRGRCGKIGLMGTPSPPPHKSGRRDDPRTQNFFVGCTKHYQYMPIEYMVCAV